MNHTPRAFLRRLPLSLVLAIIVWLLLRPVIDWSVAGFAQTLIRSFEYPRVTRLVVQDDLVQMRRSDLRTDSNLPAVSMNEITFNTIVLLALFLALPRPFSRRQLERLIMAWSVLWLCQSLNLVFHVKTFYALGLGEWSQYHYSNLARNVFGFGRYFTDLPGRFSFPFVIWLGFNWDLIMQMLNVTEDDGTKHNNASKGKIKKVKG